MAEAVPLFYGDRTEAENPSNFIKAFNRSMLFLNPLSTDAQKIKALANYLRMGSPAERWYEDLTTTQLASWDELTKAFNDRWPTTKSASQTSEEYQTELLSHKMLKEDVGVIRTVGQQKVWSHVRWADEAMELARLAKIKGGSTLIWQVKKQLPQAVRKLLDDEYMSWKTFTDDIKKLNMSKLKQECKEIEERKRREEERDQKLLQKVEVAKRATMADIMAQLQCLTIGQVAVPRTASRTSPSTTSPSSCNMQYTPPTEELKETVRKGLEQLPHQPDDEEGQRRYLSQLASWTMKHGETTRVTEHTPYPLKPGTAMICSGECFRCGTHGHGSRDCLTLEGDSSRLSCNETAWRALCNRALGPFNRSTAYSIRLVALDDQGNETGLL
ncbi:hypothetical protein M404DRAFT_153567 [Pisolithus tinctorius Marx 270]|uniref:CCHC-type domain-containing protein n=1 Tax=Pisolithus tinctorius Marx 270 TaxID=870435 RepID=A0A0C3JRJ0_PISTI|nr:hypothetical protein M404DRAFT_153567 [Pisolithus tinctorius Marx 270]